jgi:hypothetical protein
MTPCSPLSRTRRFEGTYRLHLQGRRIVTSEQAGPRKTGIYREPRVGLSSYWSVLNRVKLMDEIIGPIGRQDRSMWSWKGPPRNIVVLAQHRTNRNRVLPSVPYIYRSSDGQAFCLLAGLRNYSSTLKMEAICSSETSDTTLRTTRRHIPEDDTL